MIDNFVRYDTIACGATGTAIARQFVRKGTIVAPARSRSFAALQPIVDELGSYIDQCPIPAALVADVVLLAEPLSAETMRLAKRQYWIFERSRNHGTRQFRTRDVRVIRHRKKQVTITAWSRMKP